MCATHSFLLSQLVRNQGGEVVPLLTFSVNSFVTLCLFSRTYVANRVSDKLTEISPHVFCCRSGSSADTQAIADLVKYQLNLHRYIHTPTPQKTIMPLNPLDAVEICLNKHKVMYSVLMPSIITPIQILVDL